MPKPTEDLGTVEFLGTKVVNTHPVLKTWGVGSPAKVPLDELITERGKYNADAAHEAGRRLPDPRRLSGPVLARLSAPLRRPDAVPPADATFSYSAFGNLPDKERLHLALEYKTLNWKLQYLHNNADFYDLFGPVERSRKGDVFIDRLEQDDGLRPAADAGLLRERPPPSSGSSSCPSRRTSPRPKNIAARSRRA